jgi:hypothetical protein
MGARNSTFLFLEPPSPLRVRARSGIAALPPFARARLRPRPSPASHSTATFANHTKSTRIPTREISSAIGLRQSSEAKEKKHSARAPFSHPHHLSPPLRPTAHSRARAPIPWPNHMEDALALLQSAPAAADEAPAAAGIEQSAAGVEPAAGDAPSAAPAAAAGGGDTAGAAAAAGTAPSPPEPQQQQQKATPAPKASAAARPDGMEYLFGCSRCRFLEVRETGRVFWTGERGEWRQRRERRRRLLLRRRLLPPPPLSFSFALPRFGPSSARAAQTEYPGAMGARHTYATDSSIPRRARGLGARLFRDGARERDKGRGREGAPLLAAAAAAAALPSPPPLIARSPGHRPKIQHNPPPFNPNPPPSLPLEQNRAAATAAKSAL